MKLDLGNILLPMALALFTACTDTSTLGDHPEDEATPIDFGTTVETRAAVENTDNLKDFLVWGWHAGSTTALFDGETVHPGGSYEGGDRYWTLGQKHDFFALHPNDITATATCDKDGKLTVTNFDCSATGDEAIDLMTASATYTPAANATAIPAVPLTFAHELARVKFSVKSESPVTITSAKAYGFPYKGTLTKQTTDSKWTSTWSETENSTDQDNKFQATNITLDGTANKVQALFGGDLLLIPTQSLETDNATLTLTYKYGDGTPLTGTVKLATEPISEWQKGYSYQYTVTIQPQTADIILVVTIKPWEDKLDTEVDW